MPTPKTQQITSWSYSRYADYMTCPAKAKYKHVMKLKEPGNKAMQRGTDIHTLAEDVIVGKIPFKQLPKELELFKGEFKAIAGQKGIQTEQNWGFKKDWTPTAWDDWSGCWLRVKMDAVWLSQKDGWVEAVDHKTGQVREEEHAEQLSLYAPSSMKMFPTAKGVRGKLWYLDQGVETVIEWTAKEAVTLQKDWDKKVIPMMKDTRFAPRPGDACRWCHYRKNNGGPCEY